MHRWGIQSSIFFITIYSNSTIFATFIFIINQIIRISVSKIIYNRKFNNNFRALGYDFTQHKQRRKYGNKCFGDDPPTFEILKVKKVDSKWEHKEVKEKLSDEKVNVG